MKFRNPKKVQNFYSIEAARLWYCDKVRYCTNCAFGSHNRCIDFCEEHPIEAAHIMELEVVEDDIDLINRISKTPLTKSEVHIFSVRLCDNEVDRDYERFSTQTLEVFAGLFVGKICSLAHQCSAQIYRTELVRDTEKKTAAGDEYCCLKGWAYMLRNENSKGVIAEIEGNIKKEVSIGCGIGRSVCSICGAEADTCGHVKGQTYDGRLCFRELQNPADAFEWSFVATPAKKEEPMEKTDKPRICEVLGVEVGEEWSYPEFSGTFRINQDGYREYKTKNGVWYLCHVEKDLTEIINHPDRIIRKPRFTEEDVEDAKSITRLIDGSTAAEIERTETDTLRLMIPLSIIGKKIIDLDCTIFPSLRPGQSVSLQEILEEAPNE